MSDPTQVISKPEKKEKKDKKDKKEKKDKKDKKASKSTDKDAQEESNGLQLFKGKESQLDGVFGKGAELAIPVAARPVGLPTKRQLKKTAARQEIAEPVPASASAPAPSSRSNKRQKKTQKPQPESDSDEDESSKAPEAGPSTVTADLGEASEDESESELVHEAAAETSNRKRKQASKLPKYVPEGESSQDRDRRTIFVGNLPIDAVKSKSSQSQLRTHLLSFAPTAKIESIRFRSIPFATQTDSVPDATDEDDKNKRNNREKLRAAAWRAEQDKLESGDKRDQEEADKAKTFIDAKGKRKVAFIKKDFHSELDACNAYLVFAYPHPDRPTNVAPVLDPFEAATQILSANGSQLLGRTIRVDRLRLPSAIGLETATNALSKRDAWLPSNTDPKKSLFVGGLDYAAKEEDVRVLFEELVKSERGASQERYVTSVRIVRDSATQLGKGFGYVHFKDRESVEELLAMDESKFRFAKKKLRVQPCKTLPAKPRPERNAAANGKDQTKTASTPRPAFIPKGNPKLGEAIKDLSKEERKVYKSTDADRQARRLAKKKLKAGFDKDRNTGAVKLDSGRSKDKHVKPKAKKSKGRSAAAVSKMKGSRE